MLWDSRVCTGNDDFVVVDDILEWIVRNKKLSGHRSSGSSEHE
jgi:hypothetical protein